MRTRVKGLVYVLILLSTALFSITEDDPTAIVIALIAAPVAWIVVDSKRAEASAARAASRPPAGFFAGLFRRNGRGVPKLPLNMIVLAGAVYLCYELFDAWGNQSLIIALGHFIMLLMLCKLFEQKAVRDILQLLILSLLVVVSATMFSNSGILFTLFLSLYVLAQAYVIMLFFLGLEANAVTRARKPAALADASQVRRIRIELRFAARNCALLVAPIAVLVFCLVPRTRQAGLTTPFDVGILQTGYNDNGVQIRSSAQMTPSDAIAMRVKLSRSDGEYSADDLYFRGQVLTEYSDRRMSWQPGPDSMMEPLPPAVKPPRKTHPDNLEELATEEYTILLPLRSRFVQGPILTPDADLFYNPRDMTLRDASFGRPMRSYTVNAPSRQEWNQWEYEEPSFLKPGLLRPERPSSNANGLLLPEVTVSPQVTEMARTLAKDYLAPEGQPIPSDSIRIVMSIFENYLRAHYRYSLTYRQVDPSLDPTVDFLLHRQDIGGNCEYFASAMMMLCRAVGLNSRMVSGFHGGEFNVFLGSYALRQKDAHTWVEVYVSRDEGWVRSDPTPMSLSASGGDDTIWRWGRQFTQMVQSYWQAAVVSFDNDTRTTMWVRFCAALQPIGAFLRDIFALSNGAGFWLRMGVFGPAAALLLLCTWAIRRWRADRRKMRLVHGPTWRTMVPLSAGVWFVDEMFSLLERHGDSRRLDQTPLEYVDQFGKRLGNAVADARWLITLAYEVRFGELQLDPLLRSRIQQSLRSVKTALTFATVAVS
jgi:transglutaminase-like putative cysteine protease